VIARVVVLAGMWAATHTAQAEPATVTMTELAAAHAAALGVRLMPAPAAEPMPAAAVLVAASAAELAVDGARISALDAGRIPRDQLARCASGAICAPAVRDAIARSRARLYQLTNSVPAVVLLVDRELPFPTLLIAARSAAEAGAALSLGVAVKAGAGAGVLRFWVAPGGPIELNEPSKPALIRVDLARQPTVSATGFYASEPRLARSGGELLTMLGRLQLASGRRTLILAGSAATPAGQAIELLARSREQFRDAILTAAGEPFARLVRPR
jgi:hypothetical protein